jgi:hypothetical protein
VVIPTADREPQLERALAAVAAAARRCSEPVEVIVVDDGRPANATGRALPDPVEGLAIQAVRTCDAGVHGPAAARNLGVSLAHYDLVAFTDDDARCDERWLEVAVARLRREPWIAGLEGAVRADGGDPLDPIRARIVSNERGGGYLTASMFARAAAVRAVGGFRRLRADGSGWAVPFREDADLALRIIRDVGPIPFEPEAFVLHPAEPVDVRRLLRLARYFVVDGAFARLHPDAVPSLRSRPLVRLRIRLATAITLLTPALAPRRTRPLAAVLIVALAAGVSAQFEVEARAAGLSRRPLATLRDSLCRLPRSLRWSWAAGSARLQGEVMVALGLAELPARPSAEGAANRPADAS